MPAIGSNMLRGPIRDVSVSVEGMSDLYPPCSALMGPIVSIVNLQGLAPEKQTSQPSLVMTL